MPLEGCVSRDALLPQSIELLRSQMFPGDANDGLPMHPDPRFRYLRLQVKGSTPAMLVLAFVDSHPMGEIEVWYSAQNQVLKLQNGRIVGSQGFALDWSMVRFPVAPPAWADISPAGAHFERERDEVPSYRYGVKERLTVQPVDRAADLVWPSSLDAEVAKRYKWFREFASPLKGEASTAWYAVEVQMGRHVVVYAEQCLKPDYCLQMQRWPLLQETR